MTKSNGDSDNVPRTDGALTGSPPGSVTADAAIAGLDPVNADTLSSPTTTTDKASSSGRGTENHEISRESTPPPLPPRPANLQKSGSFIGLRTPTRPQLQSKATTALYLKDVESQVHSASPSRLYPSSAHRTASRQRSFTNFGRYVSRNGSDVEDNASVKSYAPTLELNGDLESLLGEATAEHQSPAWKADTEHWETLKMFQALLPEDVEFERSFTREFEDIDELDSDGSNEG